MVKLSEDFAYLVEKNGPPQQAQELTSERAIELRKHLPHSIVDYWLEYGFGSLHNGLFRFCDPTDFKSILALLFKADKDFSHKDCHVFGYSAFGELFVWSKKYQACNVNLMKLTLGARKYIDPSKKIDPDISIGIASDSKAERYDISDDDGKDLFKRALKKLGKLEPGEVYGFKLAPALGGSYNLDNLKKQKAFEHFSILAQADDLKLMDFSKFPAEFVRIIE
jgi:hypothetical protein